MSAHPFTTMSLLLAFGCTPLALQAAEPDPAPAVAGTASDGLWAPASRDVLHWLEPRAPLQVAVDLAAWRRSAARVKPLSLLVDAEALPALSRLRAALLAGIRDPGGKATWTVLFSALAHGEAATLSLSSRASWIHALGEPQAAADQLAAQLAELSATSQEVGPGSPEAGKPGWNLAAGPWRPQLWAGMHGRIFAVGTPDAVQARRQAAGAVPPHMTGPVPKPPPAGLWLRSDLGALVAGYAAADAAATADGLHTDYDKLAGVLGAQWRSAMPQVALTLAGTSGVLEGDVRISGTAPLSPFNLGRLITKPLGLPWPLPQLPADCLRPVDPVRIVSPHSGAPPGGSPPGGSPPGSPLAWLALGFTSDALAALTTAVQHAQGDPPALSALCQALSGEVSLLVEPGAPLPACTLALGLRAPPDAAMLGTFFAGFGLSPAAPSPELQAAGFSAQWAGLTPLGQTQLLLSAQRLVLTTAPAVAPLLASAAAQPEAAVVLEVDLPQLATLYGPLLLSGMQPKRNQRTAFTADLFPSPTVFARNLAPWQVAWHPTADGCTIHERGLPLVAAVLASAVIDLGITADPAGEVRSLRAHREWSRQCTAQAARLDALENCARSIAQGGPFSAEQRAAMRPWFAGRTPSAAELATLGTRYGQPSGAVGMQGELEPAINTTFDGRIGAVLLRRCFSDANQQWAPGLLLWAAPLGDGWSIGIVDSHQVGLFKGEPPATEPHKPAF